MFHPKSERTWFLFSETSFEKQCHNGLTEFVQLERVASRRRQISTWHSSLPCLRGKLACAECCKECENCWAESQLQCRVLNDFWELANALYLAPFGADQPILWSIASTENNITFVHVFWPFSVPLTEQKFYLQDCKCAKYKQAYAPKTVLASCGKIFFSREYHLWVFFEDTPTDRKSLTFDHYGHSQNFQTIPEKSNWEGFTTYIQCICNSSLF